MAKPQLCSFEFERRDVGEADYAVGERQSDDSFWHRQNTKECVYCQTTLQWKLVRDVALRTCESCGWWILDRTDGDLIVSALQIHGIAKKYPVDGIELPLTDLRRYLVAHPKDIAHVNPSMFEKLMGACLKDHYGPCEVIHTGRTGDRGIDIKMILTNGETFLIQVKRREDLSTREGVSAVRELNGVLFREGLAKGMVISTAKGFTRAAGRETTINTPTRETYKMELLSFTDVISMLRIPRGEPYAPWKRYEEMLSGRDTKEVFRRAQEDLGFPKL